tara:strand:+ start:3158 stop:3517 length:360 start_codon:yes stop_codon:yes gene_type:complete
MSVAYQKKAMTFAKYGDITYPFLALGEEAGEVLGKLAKAVRKSQGSTPSDILHAVNDPMTQEEITLRNGIIKELGDVQWQLAACCTEIGVTLEDIQNVNIAKLEGREVRGTIIGSGDER